MKYYFTTNLQCSFDKAVEKVTEALKKEAFGIVSEINLHEKFKEKLNVDFRKYKILGACNPAYAYEALQKEDKIGTMLPCNVIVQELSENNIEIAAIDPIASMMAIENPGLAYLATEIQEKMAKVVTGLKYN